MRVLKRWQEQPRGEEPPAARPRGHDKGSAMAAPEPELRQLPASQPECFLCKYSSWELARKGQHGRGMGQLPLSTLGFIFLDNQFSDTQDFLREDLWLFGLQIFRNRSHTIRPLRNLSEKTNKCQFRIFRLHWNIKTTMNCKVILVIK